MRSLQFETPENVLVQYEVAGLGTRFVAWFVDQIVVWVLTIVLLVVFLAAGISFAVVDDALSGERRSPQFVLYFIGMMILIWGLGSFLYFVGSELLLSGQTMGKRASKIRVVKANGFQLDAPSIVLRNLFRVVDHLPPLWLVPLLTKRSQRAGDLVAGTLVVSDARTELAKVRPALPSGDGAPRFQFDRAQLGRLAPSDFSTVERLVERWGDITPDERTKLLGLCSTKLAAKMKCEAPSPELQLPFLHDLLAAEFRRRDRQLH
jgi:uncharacterized RDD family membrane protein YckC